jgi:hypothetical protein
MICLCAVSCDPDVSDEWHLEVGESGEIVFRPSKPAGHTPTEKAQSTKIASSVAHKRHDWNAAEESSQDSQSTTDDGAFDSQSADDETTVTSTQSGMDNGANSRREQPQLSRRPCPAGDWWSEMPVENIPGLHDATQIARLLGARVVNHSMFPDDRCPWQCNVATEIYQQMGVGEVGSFVTTWFNIGDRSLVYAYEVIDQVRLEQCLAQDPLAQRVKLVIRPVIGELPFPAKSPKDADTVQSFFGKASSSLSHLRAGAGKDIACIQVDLFAKWYIRMALKTVAFRTGNVMDLVLVDWPAHCACPAVLAACRLSVTEELLHLLV